MAEFFVFAGWVLGLVFGGPIIMTVFFLAASFIGRRRVDGHVVQGFVIVAGWVVAVVWFAAACVMTVVTAIAWAGTL